MPHVDIKCFPRDLNDEQKSALAADFPPVLSCHYSAAVMSFPLETNVPAPR